MLRRREHHCRMSIRCGGCYRSGSGSRPNGGGDRSRRGCCDHIRGGMCRGHNRRRIGRWLRWTIMMMMMMIGSVNACVKRV